jgi:hypothetical protein
VKIADLAAESREAIMHQVDCTAPATTELGAAKVQLQTCCGEVDATADASKQAIEAFAKRVRQATTSAANAGKAKVDCLRGRKLGVVTQIFIFQLLGDFKDSICTIKCGSKLPTCRYFQTPKADSTLFWGFGIPAHPQVLAVHIGEVDEALQAIADGAAVATTTVTVATRSN